MKRTIFSAFHAMQTPYQIKNLWRRINHLKGVFAIFTMSIIVSACNENQQIRHDLEALHERLIDFTDISAPALDATVQLDAPRKSSLRLTTTDIQINLREFYALKACPLSKTIAERNTSLGKTQLPSIRYAYEKSLISALQNCMDILPDDNQMKLKLNNWLTQKKQALPIVWANMITQSNETYNAFAISADFISGTNSDQFHASRLALNYIVNSNETTTLESHLKTLQESRLFARMWRTQWLISQYLTQMSPLLTTYLEQNTCNTKQEKESVKIMRNIFRLFFAEKIQPVTSELNNYHYQLSPLFAELSHQLSNIDDKTVAFARFIKNQYELGHTEYKASIQQYVQLWQRVFIHCT